MTRERFASLAQHVSGFSLGLVLAWAGMAVVLPAAAQAPTVAFSAPPDGATVAGSVALGVTTSATAACVQYQVDGQVLGVTKTGPFGWTWDSKTIPDGAHVLKAIAEDAAGVDSAPALRSVTVANGITPPADTEAPKVTLTNPAAGTTYAAGTAQTFTATASDNVGVTAVQFTLDGQPAWGAISAPPFQVPWTTVAGAHVVGVTARDAANNSASASASITVTPPPVVPTMTVSSVTQGNSGNFTLTARLSQPLSGLTVTMIVTGPSGKTQTVSAVMTSGVATAQVRLKGQPLGIYTVQAVALVNGATVSGTMTFRY